MKLYDLILTLRKEIEDVVVILTSNNKTIGAASGINLKLTEIRFCFSTKIDFRKLNKRITDTIGDFQAFENQNCNSGIVFEILLHTIKRRKANKKYDLYNSVEIFFNIPASVC